MEAGGHWRIILEAVDTTGDDYRKKFLNEKYLRSLTDGNVGCLINEGEYIMHLVQKIVVERGLDQRLRIAAHAQPVSASCPSGSCRARKLWTVDGTVSVKFPGLLFCQKSHPARCMAFSPVADIDPDSATPEFLKLSAKVGARCSYREASEVLATFLPSHSGRSFTTLRKRTLAIGERIEEAEKRQLWFGTLRFTDRNQLEPGLDDDSAKESVFNEGILHLIKRYGGRTFEAAVGHCRRGGKGDPPGSIFAFEGTRPRDLKAVAARALERQDYADQGDFTVISDEAECLKRLAGKFPQPVAHVLDWFHFSTKIRPLAQRAATAPKHHSTIEGRLERIKWRLWNGQVSRRLSLVSKVRRDFSKEPVPSTWALHAYSLLETLQICMPRNKRSVANYGAHYREGQLITTLPAEGSVNRLVARQFVRKQQMRWSETGTHYLLTVRASVLNQDLRERTKCYAPKQPVGDNIASFFISTLPLFRAARPQNIERSHILLRSGSIPALS